jgi:endogenous inhibitor of DNA gyrase (YacG/DUF329 family)
MSAPRCPQCRRALPDATLAQADQPAAERPAHRPFCSERCKMADLQKWLGGAYIIPGRPLDESELADLAADPRDPPDD